MSKGKAICDATSKMEEAQICCRSVRRRALGPPLGGVAASARTSRVAFMSPLVSEDVACPGCIAARNEPHALLQPARSCGGRRRGAPLIRGHSQTLRSALVGRVSKRPSTRRGASVKSPDLQCIMAAAHVHSSKKQESAACSVHAALRPGHRGPRTFLLPLLSAAL